MESVHYYDKRIISRLIYDYWKKIIDDYYLQPNYFFVEYIRYSYREKRIKDNLWAGVANNIIPLVTISNKTTNSDKSLRISERESEIFKYSSSYFSFVLETTDNTKGYKKAYLDSLNVRRPDITDINSLWDKNDIEQTDILKTAMEFSNADLNIAELKLFDKNEECLRPATEWMIAGNVKNYSSKNPLIDIQYGEIGYKLGKILKLKELKEELRQKEGIIYDSDSFWKKDFESVYRNVNNNESKLKFQDILKKWVK
ncbi:MAG: hypothetical protein AB7S75_19850 [Desulfococcaceae bacterium]